MISKLRILLYFSLISLLFSLSGCGWLIYDYYEDDPIAKEDNAPVVYLSIQRAAHINGEESINVDEIDFEDRVHDLATMIFDSNTGALVSSYFDTNIPLTDKSKSFTLKLSPGLRDFYFVANMDMSELATITTVGQMETYMKHLFNLDEDLYINAKINKGFPMARVYVNQDISMGGNVYSPEPFYPVNDLGVTENRVKLIRAVAKLEVRLGSETDHLGVQNVYYRNAHRQASLTSVNPLPSPAYYTDKALKKSGNIYTYYMPEIKMLSPTWQATGDNKPINYFVIQTLNGEEYKVPIITHDAVISSADYLKFARGEMTDKPDYNIYRNHHYIYEIHDLMTIEVLYQIKDWSEVKTYTYMGYGYNVNVDDSGNILLQNNIDVCDPHSVKLQTLGSFTFDDDTTEKLFDNLDEDAFAEYAIKPKPEAGAGAYLKVIYNDEEVKVFSK